MARLLRTCVCVKKHFTILYIVKRKGHANSNFRNVAKNIAHHLQVVSCSNLQSNTKLIKEIYIFGPLTKMSFGDAVHKYPLCSRLDCSSEILSTFWIQVNECLLV